ncbi:DNA type IV secretion system protein ComB10 [Helicobacter cetorum]|uniref:VirB10 type IV secretion protein n=1 Tax=Helicobacter cetorum (strain ATCC BAA-429 / MIT 00-7128) TaxID=182217 RepID=I0EMH6_HELC0|nr:DNA type IV secretion system protein ComB10 [Helicobacter cetorum]AFI04145.1 VirB10 type IV secretion protein [Helicobacter cetorum MIT 00-7128]
MNIKGLLKRKEVWVLSIFPVIVLIGYIAKQEVIDEELEQFKSKFPIPDYIYQNSEDKEKQKVANTNISNNNANNTNNPNIPSNPTNANSTPSTTPTSENKQTSNFDIGAYLNSLKNIDFFNHSKENNSLNNQSKDKQQPNNNDFNSPNFDYSKASPATKMRLSLLSQRFNSSDVNNAYGTSADKNNREIEYGTDSFENFERKDKASHENKLLRTITADRNIPATLVTPISSAIGGNKIVAQVESDVYASMGRAVLIPKGSRVIGYYNSSSKMGQYRLEVVWNRIITPQGVNIILSDSKGSDVKGYNGLIGKAHNKYFTKFGMPFLFSTLSNGLLIGMTAGITENMGKKQRSGANNYFGDYMMMRLMQQSGMNLNNIINNIMSQFSQIKAVIIIKEGSRIFISPNTDIFFPIPKHNEVLAVFFKENKPKISDEELSDDDNEF